MARFVRVGIREAETELARQREGARETAVVKGGALFQKRSICQKDKKDV